MKLIILKQGSWIVMAAMLILAACSSPESKKSAAVNEKLNGFSKGTYGYDLEFLKKNNVETLELRDSISGASVLLAPGTRGA